MIKHHRCLPCCGGHVRRWRVCGPWNRAAQPHGFLELKFVGIERVEGRSDVVVVLAPVAAEAWMFPLVGAKVAAATRLASYQICLSVRVVLARRSRRLACLLGFRRLAP